MKHRGLVAEVASLFEGGCGYKAVASRLAVPKDTARNWELLTGPSERRSR